MKSNYVVHKQYQQDKQLRKSLNALTEDIYKFNFEDWYQNGYWGERYIPYSIADRDKIVANVSVSITDFNSSDKIKRYIQLGTVMTDKSYRNQGLIRFLIEEIIQEYSEKTEGIYLFANKSVLDFYPKFGFTKKKEYMHRKNVSNEDLIKAVPVQVDLPESRKALELAVNKSVINGAFEMINNPGLLMFHLTTSMKNSIYYIENSKTYAIARLWKGRLHLHQVFSENQVDIEEIIKSFGSEVKEVSLGFTPLNPEGYERFETDQPDTTLFVRGKDFTHFNEEKKIFPTLSHA